MNDGVPRLKISIADKQRGQLQRYRTSRARSHLILIDNLLYILGPAALVLKWQSQGALYRRVWGIEEDKI